MCFCLLDLWYTHTPTHNCATFMCGSMCTCTCVWVPLWIFHGRLRDNLKCCWYSPSTWFENLCLCYLLMWLESSWSPETAHLHIPGCCGNSGIVDTHSVSWFLRRFWGIWTQVLYRFHGTCHPPPQSCEPTFELNLVSPFSECLCVINIQCTWPSRARLFWTSL